MWITQGGFSHNEGSLRGFIHRKTMGKLHPEDLTYARDERRMWVTHEAKG